ncbi:MAG: ferrous iron transport protein A [Planctomycetes bacterium]|nr:ferrous iron transport protein A [Planctomycetota bacterium]
MQEEPRTNRNASKPLTQIESGQTVRVMAIEECSCGLANRLAAMGLMVNAELKVVRNGHPGPFVVTVRDTKLVLGRGMADKILVV